MDTASLQPIIRRFTDALSSDPSLQTHHEEHQRRVETARKLLQSDRIPDLTREELEAFLRDTDAWYGTRGRVRLWRELFGENDERLPVLKETLAGQTLARNSNGGGWSLVAARLVGFVEGLGYT